MSSILQSNSEAASATTPAPATTPAATPAANRGWNYWTDEFLDEEKTVWRNNLYLALTSSVITGVYSYTMIDSKNVNSAVNRALLMTLSTLLGASIVDALQMNEYLDDEGNGPMAVEVLVVPLIYYWLNKRQFQMPDLQSQTITSAFISSVGGQLVTPYIKDYINKSK